MLHLLPIGSNTINWSSKFIIVHIHCVTHCIQLLSLILLFILLSFFSLRLRKCINLLINSAHYYFFLFRALSVKAGHCFCMCTYSCCALSLQLFLHTLLDDCASQLCPFTFMFYLLQLMSCNEFCSLYIIQLLCSSSTLLYLTDVHLHISLQCPFN